MKEDDRGDGLNDSSKLKELKEEPPRIDGLRSWIRPDEVCRSRLMQIWKSEFTCGFRPLADSDPEELEMGH